MTQAPPFDSTQHLGFQRMWRRFPEKTNRHSSVWWFFLLTPRQPEGFGPKQAMVTLVSRVGEQVAINNIWHKGLTTDKSPQTPVSHFDGMALNWINTGNKMYEGIVHQPGQITLDQSGCVSLWAEQSDGTRHGGQMETLPGKPFGVRARFAGKHGYSHFDAWGDPAHEADSPDSVLDLSTPFGGSRVVAWKRAQFAGEFATPEGVEQWEGIGYFQRVCLDFTPFPWKWIWAAFEDESVFSAFIPYVGLNLLRRGDWFYPNALEKLTIPVRRTGYFNRGDSKQTVDFDHVNITPQLNGSEFPEFDVTCRANSGDHFSFRLLPHAHAQVLLDRRIFGGLWFSRYNYNEYLFRMGNVQGEIAGMKLTPQTVGNGWGNIEYTWGMGL